MTKDAFITEDFLLETEAGRRLYHEFAEDLPIIDYHCHLPPEEIAGDRRFGNMTEVWLSGDHYKWRAMRTNGVDERYCTGDAPDREKFEQWAQTVPYLLRNPLYHWTHLELKRYFGISDRLLCPETSEEIWQACNEKLAEPGFSCRGLIKGSGVVLICTTDDPVDSLEHHKAISEDPGFDVSVLPTWRPDKGTAVEDPPRFNAWVDRLSERADVDIRDYDSYLRALRARHDFFQGLGCRLSDHGVEAVVAEDYTARDAEQAFARVRSGRQLEPGEVRCFQSAMLHEFAVMDHEKGWTQQFHVAALRNNNSRMMKKIGPDTGYDSIGDWEIARPLSRFLDRLAATDQLAPTILYSLNPKDNPVLVTMAGSFQDGSTPGKMQVGSAWWFLDQKDGMERQIEDVSQMGLLSRFVGMLTDSRSFLSYARHEYFRRILCNVLGKDMTSGLIPNDEALVGRMVRDICYDNAARYFGFDVPAATDVRPAAQYR
jgi:glucuronate isomerase